MCFYFYKFRRLRESCIGPALQKVVAKCTSSVLLRVKELIIFLERESGSASNAPSMTGMVWNACEELQKVPVSNKAAYRREILEVSPNEVYYSHRR